MTLSERNIFFKGGIVFAALSLCLITAGGYFSFSAYPAVAASAAQRPWGMVLRFIQGFGEPSPYVPFWTMLGAVA